MSVKGLIKRELGTYNSGRGGSGGGRVYQNYPWGELEQIPARFETTQQKLDIIKGALPSWKGVKVLDVGCANGAVSIGMAMWGAKVRGIDESPVEIAVAKVAAAHLGVEIQFQLGQAITNIQGEYDVIVCLSVWKWIAWDQGQKTADLMLQVHDQHCDTYIFEAGISDAGTDLGVPVKHTEIPFILGRNVEKNHLRLLGTWSDPRHTIRREMWMVW